MVLDAVWPSATVTWLATEREKLAHFTRARHALRRERICRSSCFGSERRTRRCGTSRTSCRSAWTPDGRTHVFLYLVTRPSPVDFRAFLERHAELLGRCRRGRFGSSSRSTSPTPCTRFEARCREELAKPLRLVDARRAALVLRRAPATRVGAGARGRALRSRARRPSAPHGFESLYRAWLEQGDAVLDACALTRLADAIARGTGQVECHVLPHRYLHLFPLVGTA